MAETESAAASKVLTAAAETARSDGRVSEEEFGGGDGPGRVGEKDRVEKFQISGVDVEGLGGETKRETLDKDQVDGVRENSAVESSGEEQRELKVAEGGKEVAGENHDAEPSPCPARLSDQSTASTVRPLSVSPAVRTPSRDGYNWRKYGQKQVKSPKGSRSYYRCTYSDCCAKKIECLNDYSNVIEIVNKGTHSHDPPRKNNCLVRDSRGVAPPVRSGSEDGAAVEEPVVERLGYSNQATLSKGVHIHEPHTMSERKRPSSSLSDGNSIMEAKQSRVEEPEAKRRPKKDIASSCIDSVSKPGKKHRFVVHAAGDVGISGDGYRWRKYGQKMVKGNPNPRNYYRCTSAGCPVRKHIETAVDNTTAVIITYKGVHNHDMPVPKKRHGLPSAPLVAAVAPTSMNGSGSQHRSSEPVSSVGPTNEMSSETLDAGNEKAAMESARTLLSIGFEIKQC